jgi:hypothetical protein
MTQIKVSRKGVSFDEMAKQFGINVEQLKKETMYGIANKIAVNSPVDSGTYAVNHEVALRSGSFQANKTRPDDRSRESRDGVAHIPNARQIGLQNMVDDINSVDISKNTFVFRNPMAYAAMIEAGETGDKTGSPPVYASAAREAPRIIQEVAQRIASRNR